MSDSGRGVRIAGVAGQDGPTTDGRPDARPAVPLLVTARSAAGLRVRCADLADWCTDHPDVALLDVAFTQATDPASWPARVAVHGQDRADVVVSLRALAAGEHAGGVDLGHAATAEPVVMVFPGQGSQWLGMGRDLAAADDGFRTQWAACRSALALFSDVDIDDVVDGTVPLDRIDAVQPALWAVAVSLAAMWRAHGVRPAAVISQSLGEIAAATVAGALSLEDGALLVTEFSRTQALIHGEGEMVAVATDAAEVAALIAERDLELDIALVNGPRSTVVSGTPDAAADLAATFAGRGVRTRLLPIGIAGHSRQIDRVRDHLLRVLAPIAPRSAEIPMYSAAMGGLVDTASLDADFWFHALRVTADLRAAVEAALDDGFGVFVEVSPHPLLTEGIEETAAVAGRDAVVLDTVRRDDGGPDEFLRSLATAHVHGVAVDWSAAFAGTGARQVVLPPHRPDADTGPDPTGPAAGLPARLQPMSASRRHAEVVGVVLGCLADRQGQQELEPGAANLSFASRGVDSVAALGLRAALNQITGLRLPAAVVFDHPTPDALATEVLRSLFGDADEVDEPRGIEARDRASQDPIAIVGMACRLPGGVGSPEELWELVRDGRDAVAAFPGDRGWDVAALHDPDPSRPGSFYQREAGLLRDIDRFDARFFGISPREALAMDPQQRLLLETSWEALERAGITADRVRGTRTGVFTGLLHLPYGQQLHEARPELEGYVLTGTTSSVASGRLAYVLGLEGPAVTVDTACSSSLVALHLACQSLRSGECDLAFAGGATVMAEPGMFIELSRQRGLAPDGRSKAFSADADGFGLAEGVGVLLVERLSDARRAGHEVLAVVRGSAVNSDGASNGLTAPNGPSQQRVIRAALASAGVAASGVDVVEAHGTGTRLGDPIEAEALLATYGRERDGAPLYLGSLKSNIGHTQAAAGVAGVIKMVLGMRHGVLPATLHVGTPTPEVEWTPGSVELLARSRRWERDGRPRRAGVSSFGISGTNAHVIVEEGDPRADPLIPAGDVQPSAEPVPLVLSGRSAQAVRAQAAALRAHLAERPDLALGDVAWSLVTSRSVFEHRAVVVGDREAVLAGLDEVDPVPPARGRVGAVFTGQGAQRPGMGRELAARHPAFSDALDEVCALADPLLGRSLREVMFSADAEILDRTEFAQPALFAFEVALARLWVSWGVTFSVVAGHSVGEIAAAVVSGVLSLGDATRLVVARGRLMQDLPAGGVMLAVAAGADEIAAGLVGEPGVDIAAVNGPAAVVISGAAEAVRRLGAQWRDGGRRTSLLRTSHAFHSSLMEPMLDDFAEVLRELTFHEAALPVCPAADSEHPFHTTSYWLDHARRAVHFASAVSALPETDVVVELGPDAALAPLLADAGLTALPSTRRGRVETDTVLRALGRVYALGATVDWTSLVPRGHRVDLPTYAFQRESYWLSSRPAVGGGTDHLDHPLLVGVSELPGSGGVVLSGRLSPATDPWLLGHVVNGVVILPGTGFVELVACAARQVGAGRIGELVVQAPLVSAGGGVDVQVWVAPEAPGAPTEREVVVRARAAGRDWAVHATATVGAAGSPDPARWAAGQWPPAGCTGVPIDGLYDDLAHRGHGYGPAFRGLRAVWRRGEETFAEVELPREFHEPRFGIHPALLDAALHPLLLDAGHGTRLPFAFTGVDLAGTAATALRVRVTGTGDTVAVDTALESGLPVASIAALTLRAPARAGTDGLFTLTETPLDIPADTETPDPLTWVEHAARPAGPLPQAVLLRAAIPATGDLTADTHAATGAVLGAVQEWLADEYAAASRLVVVTGDAEDDPVAAAVEGLLRAVHAEHPDRVGLVATDGLPASVDVLPRVLGLLADEPRLVIRQGRVGGTRLAPVEPALPLPGPAWRLDAADAGSHTLAALPTDADVSPLAPQQVRVAVRASGLNFRDVLIGLGAYPGEARMGSEAAGVVLECGPEVSDLRPGDRVTGMVPGGGIASTAVVDRRMLTPVPAGWSFTQAASVPVAFLTAYYGLVELATLKPGESVLVHSAAGGVGTAAVQIARLLGAEVYATASPGKWPALRAAGLDDEHIASSRDLEFADRFGRVDVVLNSLAREYVDASLGLLGPGGRFVEMGKTDLRPPADVAAAYPGVEYLPFDLHSVDLDLISAMNAALTEQFAAGELRLPPIRAWDVRRAPEAFRHVEQARHTGKIVLTAPTALDPRGTVLITGGTGGLGAELARHLVAEHGVRHLMLLGRRGPDHPDAATIRSELADLGATVTVRACDAADRDQLRAALDQVPAEHPLTAVVHAAGVVDDVLVESLTGERLAAVLRPKVDAAVHLDELTRGLDLALFVLYSSASASIGAPGQAAYGAANAFLDALARRRRAAGRPALSLAWGLWARRTGITGGVGQSDLDRWARRGLAALETRRGLELFDLACTAGVATVVPLELDANRLRSQPTVPAVMRALARPSGSRPVTAGRPDEVVAARLAGLDPAARVAELLSVVARHAAAVQGHRDADAVEPDTAFKDAGFDSMTSLELRQRLTAAIGRALPATVVFDHPTPTRLATHLADLLVDARPAVTARVRPSTAVDDPPVIVGMGCRFPGGVSSPSQLWRLVESGRDAMTSFPDDRGWDLQALEDGPTASAALGGGFLVDAGRFDAEFFGISPREATAMDPQQRQLLETSWEALEDASIDPFSLAGSRTGVFVGAVTQEYGPRLYEAGAGAGADGHALTGTTSSIASGRISYVLGLEGPSLTVDTACSSSLVALHLACRSLAGNEADLALVGGATVMGSPGMFVEFSRQGGLAGDARCKSFSADADGTAWAEGVGVLVVERLSDAVRHGHRVLAVVRGSAVNQDGASNGLTAPNGPSQQRVIRAALANAGIGAAEVDAVEAHGTGTRLGDPIEAEALLATYGRDRGAAPLYLGSLKSNIGHTQAAAGIAGVIKMVLAMRHGVLPRTVHVGSPTSEVDWSSGAVELLTDARRWPRDGHPRRAGVSSFGISGTNAHVIVEQFEDEPAEPGARVPCAVVPWVLSAPSGVALAAQAARLAGAELDGLESVDIGLTLATARAAHEWRAVVLGTDRRQLLGGSADLAAANPAVSNSPGSTLVTGRTTRGRLAFLFTGQGAQRPGMGRDLHRAFPVFAAAFDEVCDLMPGVRETVFGDDGPALDRTGNAQPALFAIEVALFRLLRSWGVTPDHLAGHSVGEVAAAHVAGVLSLGDATRLVLARGRLMQALPEGGAMVAIEATESEIRGHLSSRVSLAAVNGPRSVVVSGDEDAVLAVRESFADRRTSRLAVSHAFHSSLMEPMLDEFRAVVRELRFAPPTIPVAASGDVTDPEYWVRHVRDCVRFADSVRRLTDAGVDTFVEVGPDGVLSAMAAGSVPDGAVTVPMMRKGHAEPMTAVTALARMHVRGVPVDWAAYFADTGARPAEIPTYAFGGDHYWLEPGVGGVPGADPLPHPMLSSRTELPGSGGVLLTGRLGPGRSAWIADHSVLGTVLLPGTGLVELAGEAARGVGAEHLGELVLRAPLLFPGGAGRDIQVWVGPGTGTDREVEVRSRGTDGEWVLHASGVVGARPDGVEREFTPDWAGDRWPPADAVPVPVEDFYPELAERGYEYGPAFRGTRAMWRRGDDVFADVVLPDGLETGFGMHPALLDSSMHGLLPTARSGGDGELQLPFSFAGVSWFRRDARSLRVRLRAGEDSMTLHAVDPQGRPVVVVERLSHRAVDRARLAAVAGTATTAPGRFVVEWQPMPVATGLPQAPGTWLVLGEAGPVVERCLERVVRIDLADGGADREGLASRIAQAAAVDGVVCRAERADTALVVTQALGDAGVTAPLWCLTRGAVEVGVDDPPIDVAAAGVWGLGRVAALEHPQRWGGLLDLPDLPDTADSGTIAGLLAAVLGGDGAEDQVAIRAGGVWARRLAEASRPAAEPWSPTGTVLITGGTGGLGGHVARHLAARGGCALVLVSRRGIDAPGAPELLAQLQDTATPARIVAADVADRAAMTALVSEMDAAGTPVRAVVHAAGLARDVPLADVDLDGMRAEMHGKVTGALVLDEVLAGHDLDAFVLFSSISGVWGAGGQAGYAAANACLDALALRRRAEGRRAIALAWGPWSGGGMMDADVERRLRRFGLVPLAVPRAVEALDRAVLTGADVVVADLRWARFLPGFTATRPSPLLSAFALADPVDVPAAAAAGPGPGELIAQLSALPEDKRTAALLGVVRTHVAAVVGLADAGRIDPDRALRDIGFDSLMSVELRSRLSEAVGARLPATIVFDHPTPQALAHYLHTEVVVADGPAGGVPVLVELERIEARALSAVTDQSTRIELATRMGALLERLAALDARPVSAVTGLETASAEQLMQYIDAEFGAG